ncbi:N-acetylneuraminate synthase [Candidatus Sumerlaeota bacterium]|nr:N-acetylneuraminate synthase [Candidatus Sumerlaeota bacterium]
MFEKGKTFIIAEAGVNHNGNPELARKMIDVARECGADAVKFQTFKAEKLASASAPKVQYQKQKSDAWENQLDMLKRLELSFDDFRNLKKYCDDKKIMFLSTPFDFESVDFLTELVSIFKIPSGEITNHPFLEYIAQKQKSIILSTGMSTLGEVEEAVDSIRRYFDGSLALLHCTSNYPAAFDDINLRSMLTLKQAFGLPVGYSDHSRGMEAPVAAVAMGAVIIEKHFTTDKNLQGPDHQASMEPQELKAMVQAIRNVEKALGTGIKRPSASEEEVKACVRKSLTARRDIAAGERIAGEDIYLKRPGTGISPKFINVVIGKKLVAPLKKDEIMTWSHFLG